MTTGVPTTEGRPEVRTVLVLGAHRSGTSVVTGILDILGVAMGPPGPDRKWTYPNLANPTGQYEHPGFIDLMVRIMDFHGEGAQWDRRWDTLRLSPAQVEEFRALIQANERPLWGWKHPWTLVVVRDVVPLVRNPRFIVVRRDLEQIIDSLHRRDAMTRAEAEETTYKLWERLDAVRAEHPEIPCLVVEYDRLLRNPRDVVRDLERFLELPEDPEREARAAASVVGGAALRRAIRRAAIRDFVTLPSRFGWLYTRDLREHSRFTAHHLTSGLPTEAFRILRALVS